MGGGGKIRIRVAHAQNELESNHNIIFAARGG